MKNIKILFLLACSTSSLMGYSYLDKEDLPNDVVAFYTSDNKPPKTIFPAGVLDLTFGAGLGYVVQPLFSGTTLNEINDLIVDSKDRIIAVGEVNIGANSQFALARYYADGTLDRGFGTNGLVHTNISVGNNSYIQSVVIDAHNRILVGGTADDDFAVSRYLEDGSLDPDFDHGIVFTVVGTNICTSIALDSEQRIILGGYTSNGNNFLVARLLPDGGLDTANFAPANGYLSINMGGTDYAYAVTVDSLDRIILAGSSTNDIAVARVTPAGILDTTFAGTGKYTHAPFAFGFSDAVYSVVIDGQGNILLGGSSNNLFLLVRLTSAGVLDTTFNASNGYKIYTFVGLRNLYECHKIIIDPLGRIVMMGTQTHGGIAVFTIARALSNGTLDSSFGVNGVSYTTINGVDSIVFSGGIDQQGRLILGGINNNEFFTLARYTTDYSLTYYKGQFATQDLGFLA